MVALLNDLIQTVRRADHIVLVGYSRVVAQGAPSDSLHAAFDVGVTIVPDPTPPERRRMFAEMPWGRARRAAGGDPSFGEVPARSPAAERGLRGNRGELPAPDIG